MKTNNQSQNPNGIPARRGGQPRIDPASRFGEDGSILGNNPPILSTLKGLRNHHNNHHFASKPRQNLHFKQQKRSFWCPKSTPPNPLFRVSLTRHQPIAWTYTPKTIFPTSSLRRKDPSFRESCKTHCNNTRIKSRDSQPRSHDPDDIAYPRNNPRSRAYRIVRYTLLGTNSFWFSVMGRATRGGCI